MDISHMAGELYGIGKQSLPFFLRPNKTEGKCEKGYSVTQFK